MWQPAVRIGLRAVKAAHLSLSIAQVLVAACQTPPADLIKSRQSNVLPVIWTVLMVISWVPGLAICTAHVVNVRAIQPITKRSLYANVSVMVFRACHA